MSFFIDAAKNIGRFGDAFGAAQRDREAASARASAELAQRQLKDTLAYIQGLGSQTPEQADRARQQILDGLNATTGAQIQLGDATRRNTIATMDAAGQVRKGLIGAQSGAEIAGMRERFNSTKDLLGALGDREREMATLFVGDPAQGGMSLAERASSEAAANRELALSLADRLAPKRSFGGQLLEMLPAGIIASALAFV